MNFYFSLIVWYLNFIHILPLSNSPTLPLSHSPTLQLSHSPTLQLSNSPTFPLSYSPTLYNNKSSSLHYLPAAATTISSKQLCFCHLLLSTRYGTSTMVSPTQLATKPSTQLATESSGSLVMGFPLLPTETPT